MKIAAITVIFSIIMAGSVFADSTNNIDPPKMRTHIQVTERCTDVKEMIRNKGLDVTAQFIKESSSNRIKSCQLVLGKVELALGNLKRARAHFEYATLFIRSSWNDMRTEAVYYVLALSNPKMRSLDLERELKRIAPEVAAQLNI